MDKAPIQNHEELIRLSVYSIAFRAPVPKYISCFAQFKWKINNIVSDQLSNRKEMENLLKPLYKSLGLGFNLFSSIFLHTTNVDPFIGIQKNADIFLESWESVLVTVDDLSYATLILRVLFEVSFNQHTIYPFKNVAIKALELTLKICNSKSLLEWASNVLILNFHFLESDSNIEDILTAMISKRVDSIPFNSLILLSIIWNHQIKEELTLLPQIFQLDALFQSLQFNSDETEIKSKAIGCLKTLPSDSRLFQWLYLYHCVLNSKLRELLDTQGPTLAEPSFILTLWKLYSHLREDDVFEFIHRQPMISDHSPFQFLISLRDIQKVSVVDTGKYVNNEQIEDMLSPFSNEQLGYLFLETQKYLVLFGEEISIRLYKFLIIGYILIVFMRYKRNDSNLFKIFIM